MGFSISCQPPGNCLYVRGFTKKQIKAQNIKSYKNNQFSPAKTTTQPPYNNKILLITA